MKPLPFGPIFATLRRHRTAAALIVLEFALTFAIVCNAIFIIRERVNRMQRPSGLAEQELVRIEVGGIDNDGGSDAQIREDIATLSALPGVRKAATSMWLPFGASQRQSGVSVAPDPPPGSGVAVTRYQGSEGLLETLGVRLVAGRDFTRDEYVSEAVMRKAEGGSVIITRAVAEHLWPGQDALGRVLYIGARYMLNHPLRVVGIVERLVRPAEPYGPSNYEDSVLVPVHEAGPVNYVLRVDPDRRAQVLAAAVAALESTSHSRFITNQETIEEMRTRYYQADRAMAWLLIAVCGALLVITALGIVGLGSFWVQQRTRQIGIRRALGATRRQILEYFQAENFLLATLGIGLGVVVAYGINQLLMARYELGRLPPQFLAIGAIMLWLLGQLAVLGPALRAAAVPPAVATRTV